MIEKRRILTNATSSVVQIVISGISLFFLYKFLLETIGVTQLGIWSLVLAMSSMIQVANFGLTGSIVKNIADYDALGDTRSIARDSNCGNIHSLSESGSNRLRIPGCQILLWFRN
jgi:O-antigen/teichoic acid export membrane protein